MTVADPRVVHGGDFAATLVGRTVTDVLRHGKWLTIRLPGPEVVLLHLGMTGGLVLVADAAPVRFERLRIHAPGGTVALHDRRRLGGAWVVPGQDAEQVTGPLGPDALGIRDAVLGDLLRSGRRPLKTLLVDQAVLAGLGNTLSDELLWAARLDPRRRGSTLTDDEVAELGDRLREILRKSVRAGHIPRTRGWLASQRASEAPVCPRCGAALVRLPVGGRRALTCPQCQAA
ncbi:DNA-formamidopyrimidine glycosylase family protein [Arsenicicoccus sp. oral taxon 190]|uniref:DNA-formamidopyrimidine glycosylase family protein n=1 Tax=Arsenicicoccus sp. oral taxon 190 TaxID=1658671 RepID=UPI00209DC87D|nr:DNA-formamidopyrimidine glycosylase family protein [Arsenicicoccus sp. oral taxon 190]